MSMQANLMRASPTRSVSSIQYAMHKLEMTTPNLKKNLSLLLESGFSYYENKTRNFTGGELHIPLISVCKANHTWMLTH